MFIKTVIKNRKELGFFGEQFAVDYLEKCLGWDICQRNWRCRFGELDIVAKDRECLVLIEVRTRSDRGQCGDAVESFNNRKQRKLYQLGKLYVENVMPLNRNPWIRFDFIALQTNEYNIITDFTHLRDVLYGAN